MDVPNRPVTNGRSVMNQQQMLIVSIIVALIIGVLFGHYVWGSARHSSLIATHSSSSPA